MSDGEDHGGLPENHCEAGRRGEDEALRYLQDKGYSLVQRNYRLGRGEIDLVMDDPKGSLVFIEVKSNRSLTAGHPLERVDGRKIRRLQRLAQRYVHQHRQETRDIRFDVVGVDLSRPRGQGPAAGKDLVLHIENAFLPDGAGYFPSR